MRVKPLRGCDRVSSHQRMMTGGSDTCQRCREFRNRLVQRWCDMSAPFMEDALKPYEFAIFSPNFTQSPRRHDKRDSINRCQCGWSGESNTTHVGMSKRIVSDRNLPQIEANLKSSSQNPHPRPSIHFNNKRRLWAQSNHPILRQMTSTEQSASSPTDTVAILMNRPKCKRWRLRCSQSAIMIPTEKGQLALPCTMPKVGTQLNIFSVPARLIVTCELDSTAILKSVQVFCHPSDNEIRLVYDRVLTMDSLDYMPPELLGYTDNNNDPFDTDDDDNYQEGSFYEVVTRVEHPIRFPEREFFLESARARQNGRLVQISVMRREIT